MTVFIDTSVLVAWLNPEDQRHDEAGNLMGRVLQGEWGAPILIDHVVDEMLTVLRVRVRREEHSRRFVEEFLDADATYVRLRASTLQDVREAAEVHLRHYERAISLTDALLVVHANAARGVVATFDQGLRGIVTTVP